MSFCCKFKYVASYLLLVINIVLLSTTITASTASITNEVSSWGGSGTNQLGIANPNDKDIPTPIVNFANVKKIECSAFSCHALKNDGSLWAWGLNGYFEFGNGTDIGSETPIQIGTDTDWIDVDAGETYTMAVKSNGTLWSSGENNPSYPFPAPTPETFTQITGISDVVNVSSNYFHALALTSSGQVYSWGRSRTGSAGDGNASTHTIPSPTLIPGLSNVKDICTGYDTSFALLNDGSAYEWGYDNVSAAIPSPTVVPLTGVKSIACPYFSKMAILNDGSLYNWGSGFLGNGVNSTSLVPVLVNGLPEITFANGGWTTNYAIDINGDVWLWGRNYLGELGTGFNNITNDGYENVLSPVKSNSIKGAVNISASEVTGHVIFNQYGSISGSLISSTNTPLENIVVELVDTNNIVAATTNSTSNGSFVFDNVIPGNYTLRLQNPSQAYSNVQISGFESQVSVVSASTNNLQAFVFDVIPQAVTPSPLSLIRTGGYSQY